MIRKSFLGLLSLILVSGGVYTQDAKFYVKYNNCGQYYEAHLKFLTPVPLVNPGASKARLQLGNCSYSIVAPGSTSNDPFNISNVVGGNWFDFNQE